MPRTLFLLSLFLCLVVAAASPLRAQDCAPPPITVDSSVYNIFTPEQEMIFGDLTYQQMSGDMRFIRDPELEGYLRAIGAKLVKHLPPTGLKFQFFIVDLPDANAFNIPGGYVFVSRKLIGFANNEDELAGVVAHELGHATVRHAASDMSELLKKLLNVTRLGDRKDVADKYNLLLERARTKDIPERRGHESTQQLQADRIGLFAMIAAGYDPDAFGSFFARLVEEKTTNRFSEIFGKSKPENKRLREMIKIVEQMPASCRDSRHATASETFLQWQANVISYRSLNQEQLAGLVWKKELTPKLRSDISHFAFSQDGKLLLAQDDFAITVIQREPLKVVLQIPATDSRNAEFTADGQFVVFGSENLRYEKWSLAEKKPVEIRELVVRDECWEHEYSPDGKYLACIDLDLGLNVLETKTGKKIYEKKNFYELDFLEYLGWIDYEASGENEDWAKHFFHLEFSPDSRFLAASRSNNFRSTVTWDYLAVGGSEDTLLALDLSTAKPVSVGGSLKKLARLPFLFLDATRILAMSPGKVDDGGIFSFPDGKRLARFPMAGRELQRTENPNYVIIKPLATAKLGIFDLSKNAIVGSLDQVDVALWRNLGIHESIDGKVVLSELTYDEKSAQLQATTIGTVEVAVGSIGRPEAADISENMQWLAFSSKTRGAIWNLGSGDRKMYLKGFRGALVADSGDWIADFPKYQTVNHQLVVLKPQTNAAISLREVPDKGARQFRRFLLLRQSLKPEDKKPKDSPDKTKPDTEAALEKTLTRDVRFELYDLIKSKSVWSAEFAKEAPRFFFDEFSGRLILYWTLNNDRAKSRLKENPELAARAKEMGNKDDDYLVEVVDAYAAKPVGTLLLETGKGSFFIEAGFSEADWLVLRDSENRVLTYSIKDGTLKNRFFGSYAAISPTKNQIVVENYPGELTFYDLASGDPQTRLTFPGRTAFLRFTLDGKKLFVLNSEQTAYLFDVEKLPAKQVAAGQGG
jgi:WD40 repeat protein